MTEPHARFERYVSALSDEDALVLHKIVCRRAAYIYEPRYRAIRDQNWRAGMDAMRSWRNARLATPAHE